MELHRRIRAEASAVERALLMQSTGTPGVAVMRFETRLGEPRKERTG